MAIQNQRKAPLKYDARGRLIPNKRKSGLSRFLLFYLLPYLIINGIILMLVISSPKIEFSGPDTNDYNTCTVQIDVHSLLPLKELSASIEGIPVELVKENGNYLATLEYNGNLAVTAVSLNGMQRTIYIPVNLLDDVKPVIDEESVYLQNGILEFDVSDTQSGVDFDSIYGVDGDGDNIKPTDIDKEKGHVTFSLKSDSIHVYIPDLSGNVLEASFTID